MHVTNQHSNLTPVPRVVSGSTPNTRAGILLPKKCKVDYRADANRGLNEHSCHFSTPYTCVSTAF